nr:hypothetical protein [Roseobacter litoralis]
MATTTPDRILACPAGEGIRKRAAVYRVVALSTVDDVLAAATVNDVVARIAVQSTTICMRGDAVITGTATYGSFGNAHIGERHTTVTQLQVLGCVAHREGEGFGIGRAACVSDLDGHVVAGRGLKIDVRARCNPDLVADNLEKTRRIVGDRIGESVTGVRVGGAQRGDDRADGAILGHRASTGCDVRGRCVQHVLSGDITVCKAECLDVGDCIRAIRRTRPVVADGIDPGVLGDRVIRPVAAEDHNVCSVPPVDIVAASPAGDRVVAVPAIYLHAGAVC